MGHPPPVGRGSACLRQDCREASGVRGGGSGWGFRRRGEGCRGSRGLGSGRGRLDRPAETVPGHFPESRVTSKCKRVVLYTCYVCVCDLTERGSLLSLRRDWGDSVNKKCVMMENYAYLFTYVCMGLIMSITNERQSPLHRPFTSMSPVF